MDLPTMAGSLPKRVCQSVVAQDHNIGNTAVLRLFLRQKETAHEWLDAEHIEVVRRGVA